MKLYQLVTLLVLLVAVIYGNTVHAENGMKKGMLRRQELYGKVKIETSKIAF